jgi:hypothetical protein
VFYSLRIFLYAYSTLPLLSGRVRFVKARDISTLSSGILIACPNLIAGSRPDLTIFLTVSSLQTSNDAASFIVKNRFISGFISYSLLYEKKG